MAVFNTPLDITGGEDTKERPQSWKSELEMKGYRMKRVSQLLLFAIKKSIIYLYISVCKVRMTDREPKSEAPRIKVVKDQIP